MAAAGNVMQPRAAQTSLRCVVMGWRVCLPGGSLHTADLKHFRRDPRCMTRLVPFLDTAPGARPPGAVTLALAPRWAGSVMYAKAGEIRYGVASQGH